MAPVVPGRTCRPLGPGRRLHRATPPRLAYRARVTAIVRHGPNNAAATMAAMIRSPLLVVMCVGYFLVLLDVTVVNVALPDIGGTLDPGPAGLQWVVDGYALALAG